MDKMELIIWSKDRSKEVLSLQTSMPRKRAAGPLQENNKRVNLKKIKSEENSKPKQLTKMAEVTIDVSQTKNGELQFLLNVDSCLEVQRSRNNGSERAEVTWEGEREFKMKLKYLTNPEGKAAKKIESLDRQKSAELHLIRERQDQGQTKGVIKKNKKKETNGIFALKNFEESKQLISSKINFEDNKNLKTQGFDDSKGKKLIWKKLLKKKFFLN